MSFFWFLLKLIWFVFLVLKIHNLKNIKKITYFNYSDISQYLTKKIHDFVDNWIQKNIKYKQN